MEKTTVEVALPESKAKVLLFTKLTNYQSREITKLLMANVKVKASATQEELEAAFEKMELPMSITLEMQDLTLKLLISGIWDEQGNKIENVEEYIRDLSQVDADVLYQKSGEISGESSLSEAAKKK